MTGGRSAARRVLWVLLWASPLAGQEAVTLTLDVDVDHFILGVSNLSRGIDAFSALTGVVPRYGGQHPGRGTENALVSLGAGRYLELLAPVPKPSDSAGGAGSEPARLTLAGWALHTRALDHLISVVRAAGFQVAGPTPGSRRTPEGALLEWRTAFVAGPGLESAPFFIEWGSGTSHPSSTSPGGCRLVSFELVAAEPARLQQLFRAVGHQAVVRAGSPRAMYLTLDCPRGRVSFTT